MPPTVDCTASTHQDHALTLDPDFLAYRISRLTFGYKSNKHSIAQQKGETF